MEALAVPFGLAQGKLAHRERNLKPVRPEPACPEPSRRVEGWLATYYREGSASFLTLSQRDDELQGGMRLGERDNFYIDQSRCPRRRDDIDIFNLGRSAFGRDDPNGAAPVERAA